MTMPMPTTINIAGALNVGGLGSYSLPAALPLAGVTPQNTQEQAPFAEMLATAGVPSNPLVASNMKTATLLGASIKPVAVDPVAMETMSTIVESTHGVAMQTPHLEFASPEEVNALQSAPLQSGANIPMLEPAAKAFEAVPSKPTVTLQAAPSIPVPLQADVPVKASKQPVVVGPAKALPTAFVVSEPADASVLEVSTPALAANTTVSQSTSRTTALPLKDHAPVLAVLSNKPPTDAVPDQPTQAARPNVPASAFSQKSLVPANSRVESTVVTVPDEAAQLVETKVLATSHLPKPLVPVDSREESKAVIASDEAVQVVEPNVPAHAFSPKSLLHANSREESTVVIAPDESAQAMEPNVRPPAFSPMSLVPANSREESTVVSAPDAPALAVPMEVAMKVPMKDAERAKVPEVAEMKAAGAAKGLKAHSSAASRRENKISVDSGPEPSHVKPVVVSGVEMVAQAVILQPVVPETKGAVTAPEDTAVPDKPGSGDRPKRPLAAGPTTTIAQDAPRTEQPRPTALQAAEDVVVEQAQSFAIPVSPALAAAVKTVKKLSAEEVKPGPQRHTHGALTAITSPVTQTVTVATLAPPVPASEGRHPLAQDAGISIAVAPHAVAAATPAIEVVRGVTAPETHPASLMHGAVSAPPMESVSPAQPGLGHTTLNASPTVLEVGVPGGSHGWLKIRAELVEGGTVQASISAVSHAGHETLRRDLPEMTAFLASERLSVQLHVADRPQSSVLGSSAEQDFVQTSAGAERGGGEHRERSHEESGASTSSFGEDREVAWISSSYTPASALHGGSWVNVVA